MFPLPNPILSPTNTPTNHITLETSLDTAQPALPSSSPPETCSHQSNQEPFPPAISPPPGSQFADNSPSFSPTRYTQPIANSPIRSTMDECVLPIHGLLLRFSLDCPLQCGNFHRDRTRRTAWKSLDRGIVWCLFFAHWLKETATKEREDAAARRESRAARERWLPARENVN